MTPETEDQIIIRVMAEKVRRLEAELASATDAAEAQFKSLQNGNAANESLRTKLALLEAEVARQKTELSQLDALYQKAREEIARRMMGEKVGPDCFGGSDYFGVIP